MRIVYFFLIFLFFLNPLVAQEQEDEEPVDPFGGLLCFGDSLTFGVGDGTAAQEEVFLAPFPSVPAGFPVRVEQLLSTPVTNVGVPGEIFTSQGIFRFPSEVLSSSSKFVTILEGSNDAFVRANSLEYQIALQKAVNVSRALGKEPVLGTLPETCCQRAGLTLFTNGYSERVREVAFLNDTLLADVESYWKQSCPEPKECGLLNRPEGLHPNSDGYDFIAEVFAATIEGRVPFAPIEEEETEPDDQEEDGEDQDQEGEQ